MFLRNAWYVFGWNHHVPAAGGPIGRTIIGQPIAVWRTESGQLVAMENRCPHRHAPLSLGRVENDTLRCMYHGMTFNTAGACIAMPLMAEPPKAAVRTYPIVEKDSWLWVWMGEPEGADQNLIPDAFGIDDPARPMRSNSIEYDAHYQLIHDNLCDLSHVDFVHATTLQPATGAPWSQTAPRIRIHDRAIRFERWFEGAELPGNPGVPVDVWSTYDFAVPGIFIMQGARYPSGTAAACDRQKPMGIEPIISNIEQQAVTPISATRTAYHYATGLIGRTEEITRELAKRIDIVMSTFEEDRIMIEAQQRVWDRTPEGTATMFLPQDKGPFQMRQMMRRLIDNDTAETASRPRSEH